MEATTGVILRNVSEVRQRERARELGAGLVLQLFRLLKVTQFHAPDNMAVLQQLEQTLESVRVFWQQTSEGVSMLFSGGTVFVAGQLLKATRSEYDSALELGAMLERAGFNELMIHGDAETSDLHALIHALRAQSKPRGTQRPSPRVRLRWVSAALLGADEQELNEEEQILRTYASAVVVLRDVFENLAIGRFELPHQAKRLAQKLVTLSEGDRPAFLGVTAMRNANHDAAGRAVNTAILAVAMARQLSTDVSVLARIAMSALLYDAGRPLLQTIGHGGVATELTPDEERRLPAATALVLTTLGQLRWASQIRCVLAYEAQWQGRRRDEAVYGGAREPCVASRIVATAQRFNELLTLDPAADRPLTPDEAVQRMLAEQGPDDRAMVAVLIGALGIFPSGTPVELNSGEVGVVLSTPEHPADYARPSVHLVYDAQGQLLGKPILVDLASDPGRQVVRVVSRRDERLASVAEGIATIRRPAQRLHSSAGGSSRAPSQEPPRTKTAAPPAQTQAPASRPHTQAPESRPHTQPPDFRRLSSVSETPSAPESSERPPPSSSPFESRWAPPDIAPSARGRLERTPFVQLFVYLLDRGLSGTLLLSETNSHDHALYLHEGAATRLHTSAPVAPLKEVLVELGILPAEKLEDIALADAELERALLASNLVGIEELRRARSHQLEQRLSHVFALPRTTAFGFFPGLDLVASLWGDIPGAIAPLSVLAAGVRNHPDEAAIDRVLSRVGSLPMRMHQEADLSAFDLDTVELSVANRLKQGTPSFSQLLEDAGDVRAARRVVYLLMLTRSVELGAAKKT